MTKSSQGSRDDEGCDARRLIAHTWYTKLCINVQRTQIKGSKQRCYNNAHENSRARTYNISPPPLQQLDELRVPIPLILIYRLTPPFHHIPQEVPVPDKLHFRPQIVASDIPQLPCLFRSIVAADSPTKTALPRDHLKRDDQPIGLRGINFAALQYRQGSGDVYPRAPRAKQSCAEWSRQTCVP